MNIPLRLIWKLLLINWTGLFVMMLLVVLAIHWLASSYFMSLIEKYSIDPTDVHSMFLKSVDRFMLISGSIGFVISSLLNMWLNYQLLKPISQIMHSAARISEGDFSNQVTVRGCGEIDALSGVFNKMADHLQQAEKFRRDFIVDVAHELRTPLTNIHGYMEGLRDKVIEPSQEVFESLHEETFRLVRLVEELLQLARADLAKSNLHSRCFDLSELVRHNLRIFEPRFAEKRFRVEQNLPSVMIDADEEKLTQVLTNLFENSLRYGQIGGDLLIEIHHTKQRVRFEIENDLTGPEPHDSHLLFERFQRGDVSRSREFGGTGLGLAIIKELIEAHRGSVGSRFENGKAMFWFELPAIQ
jgi:two-component system sensor histidine kinase BaeS